jgi:hypothetical protein
MDEVDFFKSTWRLDPEYDGIIDNFNPKEDFECPYFEYSEYGDDPYYPSGYYIVNQDYFKKGPRHMDSRPVWVISGEVDTAESGIIIYTSGFIHRLDRPLMINTEEIPDNITTSFIVLNDKLGPLALTQRKTIQDKCFGNPMFINLNVRIMREDGDKVQLIFHGASGLGKSYLAEMIQCGYEETETVYETDSSPELRDSIPHDIVVLGNKYKDFT